MPVRRSAAKKQRAGVTGSRKSAIPARNAPAAPMPVHTTYAVPMGSAFAACARKKKLASIPATAAAVYGSTVNP